MGAIDQPSQAEFGKPLPTELEKFACLVEEMRHHQKSYFRTRSINALNESKRSERKVDKWLHDYRNPEQQKALF